MAPTEILAEQHFLSLRKLLEQSRFHVELLTGTAAALRRRDVLARLAAGDIHLIVGTHALVQGGVNFHSLGLVIIDEQHRFGVMVTFYVPPEVGRKVMVDVARKGIAEVWLNPGSESDELLRLAREHKIEPIMRWDC